MDYQDLRSEAEAPVEGDAEAISTPPPAASDAPLIRLSPVGIVHRVSGGKRSAYLRATLVILPDRENGMGDWPAYVDGLIASRPITIWIGDEAGGDAGQAAATAKPYDVVNLQAADTSSANDRSRLWKELLFPKVAQHTNKNLDLVIASAPRTTAHERGPTAWARRIAQARQSKALNAFRGQPRQSDTSIAAFAAGGDAVSTVSAGLGQLDGVLGAAAEIDHLRGMRAFADRLTRSARHGGGAATQARSIAQALREAIPDRIPATETLLGTSDLFRFTAVPPHPVIAAAATDADDRRRQHAKDVIGAQGLAVARELASQINRDQQGFSRELPAGPIEDQISVGLSRAIDTVWRVNSATAEQARNPGIHVASADGTPEGWASTVTKILRDASKPTASAQAHSPDTTAAANLVARYVLAHRPEAQFAAGSGLDDAGFSAITRHVMLRALEDVENKRVFGLLAYPAVARVLRLVIDVEIPLSAPDLQRRIGAGAANPTTFWAAATFAEAPADARLWTPCRLEGDICVALSRGEVASAADPSGAHWRGLANLAEQKNAAPRYTLTSRHVTAAMEQLIHKSRGADTAIRSGGSAATGADATGRTVGIMLIDNDREQSVQREVAAADAQRDSLSASQATPIFLEDLSVGYRIDTCVSARDRTASRPTWRSLMGREIRFGAVRDPGGAIDVEALVKQTLQSCAPPGRDGRPDAAAFRRALDEAAMKPPTRQIRSTDGATPGSDIELGQLVPQEGVFQWHGDPLGLACGTESLSAQVDGSTSGLMDSRADLMLPVTFGPVRGEAKLPPRLEFLREYRFRARHALLGGGGIGTEEADVITASQAEAASSPKHTHLRHERVSAPHVAMLSSERRGDPGENVTTMVIRSADTRGSGDTTRRMVWAPGLPMGDAVAHPDPATPGERVLDKKPRAGRRPLGGLVNVMLDPATGGLPVDRGHGPEIQSPADSHLDKGGEGVFVVQRSSAAELRARTAHYYPDPAIDSLVVEIEPSTAASRVMTLRVPIYDRNYRQDVDGEIAPAGWRRCEYPFAMPLLLEVVSGHDPATAADIVEPCFAAAGAEVGTLDNRGRFTRLGRNRTPPEGSVTVRRVRILLPPGCEAKVRCWGLVPTERRALFDGYASALVQIRQALAPRLAPAMMGRTLDALLEEAPLPNLAEIAELSLAHAVRRPDAPSLPPSGLTLKRLNFSSQEWSDWAANPPEDNDQREWAHRHLGTAAAWVGGDLTVDGPDTSEVALSVVWTMADDVPGRLLTIDARGVPSFPLSSERIVTVPVGRLSVPERRVTIEMLTDGLKARGISLPLPDSRAYQLTVRPTAKSAFIRYFADGTAEEQFTASGKERVVWAPATRRPDTVGALEILPVFIWEEIGQDTLVRTMTVRLAWRRSRATGQPNATLEDTTQLWYSSGWQEKLAMIFDRGQPLGPNDRFTTQWGADPIRESRARPASSTPRASFAGTPGAKLVDDQWLPYPGTSDDAEIPPAKEEFASRVDLLTLDPRYDPSQDAWYADVRIDAPTMSNMWVRLGLARYQEHALGHAEDPRRDMHVSRPSTVQFELKPKRSVTVKPLPRDPESRRWPVLIEVRGALGSVNGPPRGDDGFALEPADQPLGTFFTIEVRRHRSPLFGFGDSFNETIHRMKTDSGATHDGDVLCSAVIELDDKPWGELHSVFITERDRMLSANEGSGVTIEESGPTFMAELPIRRPRP